MPFLKKGDMVKKMLPVLPALVLTWVFCVSAYAQTTVPSLQRRPGDERPELPAFPDESKRPGITLPPVAPPPAGEKDLSRAPRVFVRKLEIVGSTVFSEQDLSAVTADYENRAITAEELQEARLRLTRLYIDNGYINSGAVIPDQKVDGGVIRLQVIEGTLSDMEITGLDRLQEGYVRKRLALGARKPLNINALQERVQLLHQNPLITRIMSELGPGARPGEAVLRADVEEASPYVLGLQFHNHESASVGAEKGELYAAHRNLLGWGDALGFRVGLTEGLDDFGAYYHLPLNAYDTMLKIRYDSSDASVIEAPFDEIDIDSDTDTFGVTLTHPVYKTTTDEFWLSLSGEIRNSETFLEGYPFSFSPGVVNGKSDVTAIRFAQEWLSRSQYQVFAARSVFSVGIDAFGATISHADPDGRYLAWLGQFQWARRFDVLQGTQMIFRTDVQFANESLLPMEQFAVGGANTVRGYRENQLVRDNAVVSSLEFRIPLFRLPLPWVSKTPEDGILRLAPFYDWGWAENADLPTPSPRTISSAGLGLRWDPSPKIHAEIYWGYPFRDVDNPDNDLQDDGIHFLLDCRFF